MIEPRSLKVFPNLFFSTPFDKESVEYLESIETDLYKIASFDVVNHKLLGEVARTGKPVIMSVGMSNLEEIMAKEFPTTMECFSRYLKIHYDQQEIYNIKYNSSVRIAPSYTDFILRGIKYTVPFRAIMNLKHKETGEKIVIWCIPFDGNNCDIKIHYDGTREDSVGKGLWSDFMDFFWKESLLVGQCFYVFISPLDNTIGPSSE